MHTASWASLQLSGVIQLNAGTVLSIRSWTRPLVGLSRLTTWLASQLVPPFGRLVERWGVRAAAVDLAGERLEPRNGVVLGDVLVDVVGTAQSETF